MLSNYSTDFVIGSNGHAGLSNRKTAELLKVNASSITKIMNVDLYTESELQTISTSGFQGVALVKLAEHFAKSNQVKPETRIHCLNFLSQAATIGAQTFINQMAGVIHPEPQLPTNFVEALRLLLRSEEQKQLLQTENEQLQQENILLAEVVDELFDYSAIIRVAKFNGCSERMFNWRKLKAASTVKNLEIKSVPCPRFGTKNLYHHDAWRYVYPDAKLPETTTLTIATR